MAGVRSSWSSYFLARPTHHSHARIYLCTHALPYTPQLTACISIDGYLAHGSKHQLPIGTLAFEEISRHVHNDEDIKPDVFDEARQEAFDYLHLDVWKSFHDDQGPNGYTALMKKAERTKIKKTASALTVAKGEKDPKNAKEVKELLKDPTATTFLKEFLTKTADQTSLLFCEFSWW